MRRTRTLALGIVGAALAGLTLADWAQALEVGQKAPDFTLPEPGGKLREDTNDW
jgi:hypothetical protein